eukprot:TRINITY_DN48280_c0_g1_i1.p1 TRINITY_DN48280_c0_g1~~TRINITY_DN48280_c0_g1_i1.p1  ORF type:complete len:214 (+),score=78.59 TRINITY_DN48280_c0_g1_i1:120-761(+)
MVKTKNPAKANKKDKGSRAAARTKEEQEAADAEVAAQVKEIEERLQAYTVEMKQVEAKLKHYMMEAKRAELTEKELQPLPDSSKVYRQVGKMFILQPKADLAMSLKAQQALKSVESHQLKQAYAKIQEKVKSEADGLKELIGPEKMKALFAGSGSEGQPSLPTAGGDGNAMMPIFGKATSKTSTESGYPSSSAVAAETTTESGGQTTQGSVEV